MSTSATFRSSGIKTPGTTAVEDGARFFVTSSGGLDGQLGTFDYETEDGTPLRTKARLSFGSAQSGGWVDRSTGLIPKDDVLNVYEVETVKD